MNLESDYVRPPEGEPIWGHFPMLHPLVVVGTAEEEGTANLAPKTMVTPLSWQNWFGFVCTPYHHTYHNALRENCFAVSFPSYDQADAAVQTATHRDDEGHKPYNAHAIKAPNINAYLFDGAMVHLECETDRFIDGFGENALIVGRVIHTHIHHEVYMDTREMTPEIVRKHPLPVYIHPGHQGTLQDLKAVPLIQERNT